VVLSFSVPSSSSSSCVTATTAAAAAAACRPHKDRPVVGSRHCCIRLPAVVLLVVTVHSPLYIPGGLAYALSHNNSRGKRSTHPNR
jgi:hypothetical protein